MMLIVGKSGQLAQSLIAVCRQHAIDAVALGRPQLDLLSPQSISSTITRLNPSVVIMAAAYTQVDKAEDEPGQAFAVNADGAGAVAAAAARAGIPVVYISTDYVFDGSKTAPYSEDDPPNPLSVYGSSKLKGEEIVAAQNNDHVIVRTSWLYSPFGSNFLKTMLRISQTRDEVSVVADQIGCPTSAFDLAEGLLSLSGRLRVDPDPALRGVFHMCGRGATNWADFADEIFRTASQYGLPGCRVKPISTAEYRSSAVRPANSVLCGKKLADIYGIALPDWRQSTRRVVQDIIQNQEAGR